MLSSVHTLTAEQWWILAWLGLGKLLTIFFVSRIAARPSVRARRVYQVEIAPRQRSFEIRSLWVLATDPLVLGSLIAAGWIRFADNSAGNIALTVGVMLVWAEVWMYWTHRLMHASDLLWKIHARHHASVVPTPATASSFSLLEKLFFYSMGWLLFLAGVSWVLPVSIYGIVAFYSFYFVTSPIAHANAELIPGHHMTNLPLGLGKVLGTASGHALHHGRGAGNFGFITTLMDRLFGTLWPDNDELHTRVLDGGGIDPKRVPDALIQGGLHEPAV